MARKITNRSGFPDAVVQGIINDDYDRGNSDYTITELLKPPRVRALQERYKDEIEVDVEDLIYAFEGKILHKVLEKANRTGLIEKRFFAKIIGKTISAQIDTLAWDDDEPGVLSDWKRCPAFKMGQAEPDPDWVFQTNGQAWILRQNGIKVTGLQIVAFAKDHSKTKSATQRNYPKKAIMKIPIPMWSYDEIVDKISERIELHEAAKIALPDCTDNERWKRFNRDFKGVVALRCLSYCEVSKWCSQYQNELKEQTDEI